MSVPRYPFVHIDVPADHADEASVLLFELGADGVEERDASTLEKSAKPGCVTLVAAFSTREGAEHACAELAPLWEPRIQEIVGDGWRDAWKEHYKPFALTPRITVRPPWETYAATRSDEIVIELEPGRAFGTGLHATTSLVAKALDREEERVRGASVLDVGTGSGILAIVAVVLGAARAVAIDVDADAVAVARGNAARNGLAERVDASTSPLSAALGAFPVVVANIEARVLIPMANALGAAVAPGGLLVLSGILRGQEDDVTAAYAPLRRTRVEQDGEWVALSFER